MQVIKKDGWLRLIEEDGFYKVQVRYWFKWRDVTFGPYTPNTVGLSIFKHKSVVELEYIKCLFHGRSYTLQGVR